jgi:hypothetical protein
VYAHHAHRPGYKIVPRSPSYVEDMSSSLFCLAPTGGGHGKRQVLVARFGCIPVPITDFVLQVSERLQELACRAALRHGSLSNCPEAHSPGLAVPSPLLSLPAAL